MTCGTQRCRGVFHRGAGAVIFPSGSYGGTRLATLRMMNSDPGSASKIADTSTRASQQAITIAVGDSPSSASLDGADLVLGVGGVVVVDVRVHVCVVARQRRPVGHRERHGAGIPPDRGKSSPG